MKPLFSTSAMLAFMLSSNQAFADFQPGPERFKHSAEQVGSDAMISAMWVREIPKIAEGCGMELEGQRLGGIMQHFGFVNFEGRELRLIDSGRDENLMETDWKIMLSLNHNEACSTADALWGDKGSAPQFGVISKP